MRLIAIISVMTILNFPFASGQPPIVGFSPGDKCILLCPIIVSGNKTPNRKYVQLASLALPSYRVFAKTRRPEIDISEMPKEQWETAYQLSLSISNRGQEPLWVVYNAESREAVARNEIVIGYHYNNGWSDMARAIFGIEACRYPSCPFPSKPIYTGNRLFEPLNVDTNLQIRSFGDSKIQSHRLDSSVCVLIMSTQAYQKEYLEGQRVECHLVDSKGKKETVECSIADPQKQEYVGFIDGDAFFGCDALMLNLKEYASELELVYSGFEKPFGLNVEVATDTRVLVVANISRELFAELKSSIEYFVNKRDENQGTALNGIYGKPRVFVVDEKYDIQKFGLGKRHNQVYGLAVVTYLRDSFSMDFEESDLETSIPPLYVQQHPPGKRLAQHFSFVVCGCRWPEAIGDKTGHFPEADSVEYHRIDRGGVGRFLGRKQIKN